MIEVLIALLVPVLILAGIVFILVKRGLEMKELSEHGIETVGRIVNKRSVKSSSSSSRRQKLVYRYTDTSGAAHEHTSVVPSEVYHAHEEGGTIPVVYSPKKPAVSAPKYLVDQARTALGK